MISLADAVFPLTVSLERTDPAKSWLYVDAPDDRVQRLDEFTATGTTVVRNGRMLIIEDAVPPAGELLYVYPNPVRDITVISFRLDRTPLLTCASSTCRVGRLSASCRSSNSLRALTSSDSGPILARRELCGAPGERNPLTCADACPAKIE